MKNYQDVTLIELVVGLRKGTSWQNPERRFISFRSDSIFGGDNTFLGKFNSLQWYDITVSYEKNTADSIKLNFWINGNYKGIVIMPTIAEEDNLLNLELNVQEGSGWFDDVVVKEGNRGSSNLLEALAGGFETYLGGIIDDGYQFLSNDYNNLHLKHFAYINVGFEKVIHLELLIDLDDYVGITPEGKQGWVTAWIDGGINGGLGLLPCRVWYIKITL